MSMQDRCHHGMFDPTNSYCRCDPMWAGEVGICMLMLPYRYFPCADCIPFLRHVTSTRACTARFIKLASMYLVHLRSHARAKRIGQALSTCITAIVLHTLPVHRCDCCCVAAVTHIVWPPATGGAPCVLPVTRMRAVRSQHPSILSYHCMHACVTLATRVINVKLWQLLLQLRCLDQSFWYQQRRWHCQARQGTKQTDLCSGCSPCMQCMAYLEC